MCIQTGTCTCSIVVYNPLLGHMHYHMTAYVVGLICTYIALAFMKTAQPALLYLVPTTLLSVTLMALIRREFVFFFTGKRRVSKTISSETCPIGLNYHPTIRPPLVMQCPSDAYTCPWLIFYLLDLISRGLFVQQWGVTINTLRFLLSVCPCVTDVGVVIL